MRLGRFIQDAEGNFNGAVKAYGMPETQITFAPKTSSQGKSYYEVMGDPETGAFDGGAAFPKKKGDMEYLSVTLESPMFPAPVNAGLFQDKANPAIYNLVWDRPEPRPQLNADAKVEQQQQQAPEAKGAAQKAGFFRGKKPAMNP